MAMARAVPAQLTWAGPVLHPLHGIAAPTQPEIISHRTRQGLQVYYKIFNILVCQCVWERSQEEEKNGGYWEGRSRRRGSYGYRWRFNLQIRPTHRFASRVSLHPAAKSWSLCKASKVFYPFSFKPIQPTFSNSFFIVLRPCVFFFFVFAHQNSVLGFSNQYEFLIGFFFPSIPSSGFVWLSTLLLKVAFLVEVMRIRCWVLWINTSF